MVRSGRVILPFDSQRNDGESKEGRKEAFGPVCELRRDTILLSPFILHLIIVHSHHLDLRNPIDPRGVVL